MVWREKKKEKGECDDEVGRDGLREKVRERSLGSLGKKSRLVEEEKDDRLYHQQRSRRNRKNVSKIQTKEKMMKETKKETLEDKKTS